MHWQLWLVEGGGANVFEGGMDKYHEHVLSKHKALKGGASLQQAAAEELESPTADDHTAGENGNDTSFADSAPTNISI
jgi:hypothetical protein